MPDLTDPRKAQEALHKAVVDVAKAISDAFYKVDAELLGLPPNNPIGTELKAIRDNIFVQKQRAEKLVSGASEALQTLPPAPPEEPEPLKKQPEPPKSQPQQPRQASVGVPSRQAETMVDCLKSGGEGKEGSLSTDGKVVSLAGTPIFKLEKGKLFASWTSKPSMTVASNVNSLAAACGVDRVFTMRGESPMALGKPVTDPKAWIEIGTLPDGV